MKACIHDYFFAKAVALTRPGGVIAFITSRYTLDKKNRSVREWLAQHTDLLGAVRLPDTAFLSNAGTEVVTDILFLQKRYELRQGDLPSWVDTQEVELDHSGYLKNDEDKDGKVRHNLIYCEHPEWMVGHVATKRGMYSAGEYTVKYDGDQPIGDGIARRIEIEFGKPSGWMDIPSTTQQDHAEYQVMPDTLSEEEKHLLKNFRALSTNQKATLKSVCDALAQTATTKKVG